MLQEQAYAVFRSRLTIDMMRLDEDLINHPMLMQQAGEIAADALQIRDACNHDLAVVTAKEAQNLRVADEDGKTPSEARINSQVILSRRVKAARTALEDAQHDLDYWQIMVNAIREKGNSMKRIAELTIAGYLAPNAAYSERRSELRKGPGNGHDRPHQKPTG